jgi:hypothetical protein
VGVGTVEKCPFYKIIGIEELEFFRYRKAGRVFVE